MISRRALLIGHFSTVGDIESLDIVSKWLSELGFPYDIAPFTDSVRTRMPETLALNEIDPTNYPVMIMICGPVWREQLSRSGIDLEHFSHALRIGINLSMVEPLGAWNPFDLLLERDSDRLSRPDLTLLADTPTTTVVGRCLVKNQMSYEGRQRHIQAAALFDRLAVERDLAAVDIDTRWYREKNGLRSPAHVFSLLKRLDVLLTNRLHGMVYALKAGVPVIAIDAIEGGAKLMAQAKVLDWPACILIEEATEDRLSEAMDWCMTDQAKTKAAACRDKAVSSLLQLKWDVLLAISERINGR